MIVTTAAYNGGHYVIRVARAAVGAWWAGAWVEVDAPGGPAAPGDAEWCVGAGVWPSSAAAVRAMKLEIVGYDTWMAAEAAAWEARRRRRHMRRGVGGLDAGRRSS